MPEIKRAIALGFFDGVHLGHAALLKKTKQRAEEIGAVPSVLSFDVHPDMLVFGKDVPLINSALGREEIIRRCFGIDNVVFIHFNQHVMRMPWDEFIDSLIRELNISWIVVGHDFCFGYKGEGTAERLKAYCESFLKFFSVIIGSRFLDLFLDRRNSCLDCIRIARAVYNNGIVFIDLDLSCATEHIGRNVFEFDAEFGRNHLTSG